MTRADPLSSERGGSRLRSIRPADGRSLRFWVGLVVALVVIPLGVAATRSPAVVVLPVLGGIGYAMLRRPNLAIYLVLLGLYTNAAVVAVKFENVPAFAAAAFPLLLAVPLANQFIVRRGSLIAPPALIPLLAFLLFQVTSAVLSSNLNRSADTIVTFVSEGLVLFLLISTAVQSRTVLIGAMWAIVIGGALLGALSAYQQATGTFSNNYFGFAQLTAAEFRTGEETLQGDVFQLRLAGPIGESNFYAQILAVGIPMAMGLFRLNDRLPIRAIAVGAGLAIASGVALTFSRGAVVGLVIALLIAIVLRVVHRRQVLILAAGAVLVVLLFPGLLIRLATLDPTSAAADAAIQGRSTENAAAALAFLDHPILGVGPGLFPTFYQTYAQTIGVGLHAGTREAHNLYLGLAAETGLAGVIAFGAILFVTFRALLQARRLNDEAIEPIATALLLSLVIFLTTSLFLHLAYERYFWLLMALAAAAGVVGRERARALENEKRARSSSSPILAQPILVPQR
jgi:putative inorganic carbon (HCO3(-)) transporter